VTKGELVKFESFVRSYVLKKNRTPCVRIVAPLDLLGVRLTETSQVQMGQKLC